MKLYVLFLSSFKEELYWKYAIINIVSDNITIIFNHISHKGNERRSL